MATAQAPVPAWTNWVLGTAFAILVFVIQTGYAVTNISVAQDLSLTTAQIGLVGSTYTWALATSLFLGGSLLDRLGARHVLPGACLLVTVGAFLFATAGSITMLVAGQLLLGIGGCFGFIGAGFVGRQWFDAARYGLLFGLVQLCCCLAALVSQRVLGSLVPDFSWNTLVAGMAWAALALTLSSLVTPGRGPWGATETRWSRAWPRLWSGRFHPERGSSSSASAVAARWPCSSPSGSLGFERW